MKNNSENKEQPQCCSGNCNCNQLPSQPGKTRWLKILVFLGVLLLATGIAGYVLSTRYPESLNWLFPSDTGNKSSATSGMKQGNSNIYDFSRIETVKNGLKESDFLFIILLGQDAGKNGEVKSVVNKTVEAIRNNGTVSSAISLNSTDTDFSLLTNRLVINDLPAVVAFSNKGNMAIVKENITENKLYEAYIIAYKFSCCPSSTSKCCGE